MTDLTAVQGTGGEDEGGSLTPEEFQRMYDEFNATMPSMSELIAKWITPRGIVDLDPTDLAPDEPEEWDDPNDPWFEEDDDEVDEESDDAPDDDVEDEGTEVADVAEDSHYDADDYWDHFDDDEDDEFAGQNHDSVRNGAAASAQGKWEQLPRVEGAGPGELDDAALEAAFDDVRLAIQSKVETMLPDQFIIIEFRGDPSVVPFTQAAMNSDWIHCEVVSEEYIADEEWPIDEAWLRRNEWRVPDEAGGPNWWMTAYDAAVAATFLVEGLRFGRVCPDPHAFAWRTATFLVPPWK